MFFKKLTALSSRQANFRNALLWLSLGLAGGVLLWNGFMWSLDATGTTEFCISCHSMKAYVYEDYKQSIHYRNTKGIQASCADCHIPKPLFAKLVRKTIALNDLYHTMLGSLDTPEQFAAQKQQLAERVWNRMRASDSRECRSCHRLEQMDFEQQNAVASRQHQQAKQLQKTCIDCHQGVAHKLANVASNKHEAEENFSLE